MNEIIKKNGLKFGILSGVVFVLITTFVYVVNVNLFASMWLLLLIIVVSLTISFVMLNKTKKEMLGNLSFKEAFTTYFIMSIVGLLISTLFNIILFNVIEPDLKETVKEITIKASVEMMQKFEVPQSEINKAIAEIAKKNQFETTEQIKGLFGSLLFSCFIGLILAAFFRTPNRQEI